MKYYLSQISVFHDGGRETKIENTWILVDAAVDTLIDLGTFMIDEVEYIRFHIGVEEAFNHFDPASWPPEHPLAPQNPSMHWGWSPGYIFIAYEGRCGPNLEGYLELHALRDLNYTQVNVGANATAQSGEIQIEINADYAKGLHNIVAEESIVIHDGFLEAQDLIKNFGSLVFENTFLINGLDEVEPGGY